MTVKQFKEKYNDVQKKSIQIYSSLKPILRDLKKLAKTSGVLWEKANNEENLYVNEHGGLTEDGWNTEVLFALDNFSLLTESIEDVEVAFDGMVKTKFKKTR